MIKIGSEFSGYGGLEMGVINYFKSMFGEDVKIKVAWHTEIDKDANMILNKNDPGVPNLGDITKIKWNKAEKVDVITGGFPCQDLSHAGKRKGLMDGTRSGLWLEMARSIEEMQPRLVIIENVQGLLSACAYSKLEQCPGCLGKGEHRPVLRGLGRVLGDLAGLGYDARWTGLRASDIGAPHLRFREFIVATPRLPGLERFFHDRLWTESITDSDDRRGNSRFDELEERRESETIGSDHASTRAQLLELRRLARSTGTNVYRRQKRKRVSDSDGESIGQSGSETGGTLERGRKNARSNRSTSKLGLEPQPEFSYPEGFWGPYGRAVRRWELIIGRPVPAPTIDDRLLNPRFVEWMMGLPDGHVTETMINPKKMRKALGNGVCPPQATAALMIMMPDLYRIAA
jgi:DNA (cytosine-5)-methyltransferase 1